MENPAYLELPLLPISSLLPLTHLTVEAVEVEHKRLSVTAASVAPTAACPLCQSWSTRIHSRYTRTVADLACMGRSVILSLRVRKFVCDVAHCPRRIFAERFGAELPAFARRTTRLRHTLLTLAFAAGGHGGARLAHALALPTSLRTLLRLMHADAVPPLPAPHVVGLDEWAWKKGRNYGTICVDLERRQPIDLLPDHAPDTIVAWLRAHPTISVIARDRSGGFTEAATRGAPHAIQVADRFHLLQNLSAALERFFLQHGPLLKRAAHAVTEQMQQGVTGRAAPRNNGTVRTQASEAASLQHHAVTIERYHRIHALHAKRVDIANIARQVGVSRETVYRYLRMSEPPRRKQAHVHGAKRVDPYIPYLLQRWNDGCRSARQLYRELVAQGYRYGEASVQRYICQLRRDTGTPYKFRSTQPAQLYTAEIERQRPLSAGQVARMWLARPEQRQPEGTLYLAYLGQADEAIARTLEQAHAFATMVRERQGEQLDGWLAEVETTGAPELQAFARGIHKDYAAVKAGLTLAYSNGQTEAQVQRLKLLKRGMYGQAGFELLRKRVLHRDPPLPIKRQGSQHALRLAA